MSYVTLLILTIAFGYAAVQRAGVQPQDWCISLLLIALAAVVHALSPSREKSPPLDRFTLISASIFLAVAALQVIPFPLAIVHAISPHRAEIFNAALPFVGEAPQALTISAVPFASLLYVFTLAGYALVAVIVRDLSFRLRPWIVIWPLLLVVGFEAGLGVFQAYGQNWIGEASGTYVNRDHFAGLVEMVLPFAVVYPVAILLRDREQFETPAAPALKASALWGLGATMLIAIMLSLSRMGFIVALFSLLIVGGLMLSVRTFRAEYSIAGPWWRKALPWGLLLIIVIGGFVMLPTDPLVARFADFAQSEGISADTRTQIWRDTIALIKDYPGTGCGIGAYESCLLRYKTVAPMMTVDYAHNDYLQVLAELGVIGFIAGLIFVANIFQHAARAIVFATSLDQRYIAIACVGSMTAILLHSFVDFNMYVPANGLLFAWIAGVAGVFLRRRRTRPASTDSPG